MSTRVLTTTERRARGQVDAAALVRRVLELERSHGYTDRAVIGGLGAFMERWTDPSVARAFAGYDQMNTEDRVLAVNAGLSTRKKATASLPLPEPNPSAASQLATPGKKATATSAPPPDSTQLRPLSVKKKPRAVRTDTGSATAPIASRALPAARSGGGLLTHVGRVPNVGAAHQRRLERLGITNIQELLHHFPRRHLDYSKLRKINELSPGELVTIIASVWEVGTFPTRRGLVRIEATIGDDTGTLVAVWFRRKDYFSATLRGKHVLLSGRIELRNGQFVLNDPEIEPVESAEMLNTSRFVPQYPLTEGITQRWLRQRIKWAIDQYARLIEDEMPLTVRLEHRLVELSPAIANFHFPDDESDLASSRRRLAFEELFVIQCGVAVRRRERELFVGAPSIAIVPEVDRAFRSALPFSLTGAQVRVSEEIAADLALTRPMARLLQGDVGAGKTAVAAIAILGAIGSGYQAVMMAPTEILAEQHFRSLTKLIQNDSVNASLQAEGTRGPLTIHLLTGGTRAAKRRAILTDVEGGSADLVVGTHAVIQDTVVFQRLGLAVVDEQHRFGVLQRNALQSKGTFPHMLVMTATPIPRTLALTVYGELDVSVIDELPPGRQAIKTRVLGPNDRTGAYEFIRAQVSKGRQAFIVCPLVDESENSAAKSAIAEFERLSAEVFTELQVGLLHGRLASAEKDAAMTAFRDNKTQILVATVVIEVGIDIPNATVMLIDGADRFGLAQLHQLRGRVGRGADQSYCLLLTENPSIDGQERLRVMEETNDGFELAEADLALRGPGEFLGTRQSGLPDLRVANLGDVALVQETRKAAFALVARDPDFSLPEDRPLGERVATLLHSATDPV